MVELPVTSIEFVKHVNVPGLAIVIFGGVVLLITVTIAVLLHAPWLRVTV